MLRYCGALTQVTGQGSVFINSVLAAVEGDKGSHGDEGDLVAAYGPGNIFIEGKKLIVAMGDRALPDIVGTLIHPFCPTGPSQGSSNVFAYDGLAGGGIGSIIGGNLNIAELVSLGGQVVGMVKNFTNMGGGTGQVVLQNMGNITPSAGDTLVGMDTGNSIVLTSFERSYAYDRANTGVDYTQVMETAICDDTGVIAVDEYFTGKPSQDYNSTYVVRNE